MEIECILCGTKTDLKPDETLLQAMASKSDWGWLKLVSNAIPMKQAAFPICSHCSKTIVEKKIIVRNKSSWGHAYVPREWAAYGLFEVKREEK